MKTKKVGAILPLLAGIGLSIISLTLPFIMANHYIFAEGKRYSADNYLFFFWGKYYTVAGANLIQSQAITNDFGDWPLYVMISIIIGLIIAALSMFGGRGLVLNIKGRNLKLKFDINPVWLQASATILILASYLYTTNALSDLVTLLQANNYVVEYGPSLDFLLGGLIALIISTIMTSVKFLSGRKEGKT